MDIKVGTDYKRRDGFKAHCVEKGTGYHGPNSFMVQVDSGVRYPVTEHGLVHFGKEADADVVGEWSNDAKQETGTLAELDVKPGDVVEFVSWEHKELNNDYSGPWDIKYNYGKLSAVSMENNKMWFKASHNDVFWRIISRATQDDKPKTWGEMTDAEKGALMVAHHNKQVIEVWALWKATPHWVTSEEPVWGSIYSYRIKPEPVVETVTIEGWMNIPTDIYFDAEKSNEDIKDMRLTFTTRDGEPATGRFVNEAGDVITLEQIGGEV